MPLQTGEEMSDEAMGLSLMQGRELEGYRGPVAATVLLGTLTISARS